MGFTESQQQQQQLTPEQAYNLAMQHLAAGRVGEADVVSDALLAADPNHPAVLHLKGVVAYLAGRNDQSAELIGRAIAIAPGVAEFHRNLCITMIALGRLDDALAASRRAIQLEPRDAQAHYNLGSVLYQLARFDESADAYRSTIAIRPDHAQAYTNLGSALQQLDRNDEAIPAFTKAIELDPKLAEAHNNLGNSLSRDGRAADAVAAYRKAIEVRPDLAEAHSNLLLNLHYVAGIAPSETFAEHVRFGERHAPSSLRRVEHCNDRSPQRRLRVGYLSPDYCRHPVASFLEGLLEHHDREQVEEIAYSNTAAEDVMTRRLRAKVDHWRDISRTPDDAAASMIEADRIDVLVDLAGHTAGNRARLMARGAAPVQVTYLGYPDTTGVRAVGYRFTDVHADPPGMTEALHTETLVRLPDCFLAYRPDDDAPPVVDPPSARNGYITFGAYNFLAKVNEPMLALWAQILTRVPKSRLLIKARALNSDSTRRRLTDFFASRGVSTDRLELLAWTDYDKRHAAIAASDIALDTFPYHGTTTTCEVLWDGVPTVTLEGCTHVSRVGVSIMKNVGLDELIATNEADYVEKAVALANDPARLARLRREARERMSRSALLDRIGLARKIESAYRDLWRQWCETGR